ncbi:MAG: Gfo/Idh/MocA family oxidoreductase [Sandaracinaceae bacterium]|nr:Gfo/Idh/MocA family oxidoreductase [Sandaracinaceae bacterium]
MTLKVAVVGAGSMGKNHARVLQTLPSAELVAVVDADLATARAVTRLHGGKAFDRLEDALMSPLDAAIVAVPTQHHFDTTKALLAAGVHVLVEKPIAATVEEARELGAIAEREKRVLAVGHVERFNPAIQLLAKKLAEGALGRVFEVRARRVGPFPARIRDVGVALDLGTHDLDVMRFVVGAEIARVYAETKREIHTSREDLVSALLRFENDVVGVLEVNWLTPTKARELTVTGERGMFHVDYLTQDLYFYENADAAPIGWQEMSVLRGVSEGSMTKLLVRKVEPLRTELETFLAAASGGDASRIVSPADGTRALELATAVTIAASEARPVIVGRLGSGA